MRSGGFANQLKVRNGGTRRSVFEKVGGDWMETTPEGRRKTSGRVGEPTTSGMEKRAGSSGWKEDIIWQTAALGEGNWKERDWAKDDRWSVHWEKQRGEPGNPSDDNRWMANEWWRNEWNSQTTECAPSQDARDDTNKKEVRARLGGHGAIQRGAGETSRAYATWTSPTRGNPSGAGQVGRLDRVVGGGD